MTDLRQRLMDEVERDPPVGIGAIVMRLGVDMREAEAELRAMQEDGLVIGRGGLWGPTAQGRAARRPAVRITTTREDDMQDQETPSPRATADDVRGALREHGGWATTADLRELLPDRSRVSETAAKLAARGHGVQRRGERGGYEYSLLDGWSPDGHRDPMRASEGAVMVDVATWRRLCAALGMEPSADAPTPDQVVEAAGQRARGAAEDGATYRERVQAMRDRIIRLLGLEGRDRDVSDHGLHLQLGQEVADLRGSVDALRDTHDRYEALRAALVAALPTGDRQDSDYQLVAEVRTRIQAALRIEEGWRSARTSLGNLQSSWRLLCELLELPERSPWEAVRDRIREHLAVQSDQDSTLSGIAAKLGVRRDCDILSAVVDLHKRACVLEEQRDDARRLLDRPRRAEVPDAITGPLSVEDLTASDLRRAWRVASAVAAAGLGATPDALGALGSVLRAAEERGRDAALAPWTDPADDRRGHDAGTTREEG